MRENDMGNRIRTLRLSQGLTLEQVAQAVGVGKSTVRKWETGMIANMKQDKIAALAAALHTTPLDILGVPEEPQVSPDEWQLTEGEAALVRLLRQVPQDKQRIVIEMIRAALNSG